MPINDWPTTERPREKLLRDGATSLSSAELLAILFRTGTRGKTAVDIGRELLIQSGGLAGLMNTPPDQLRDISGLGDTKIASVLVIQELARRAMREKLDKLPGLTNPAETKEYLCMQLAREQREVFWVLFLNSRHQIIASEALFYGTIDGATVYPREVLKACVKYNAAAVIFAHNHPSGSIEVSEPDKQITRTLQQVLGMVDIRVLDHLIIGGNRSISMAELGLI